MAPKVGSKSHRFIPTPAEGTPFGEWSVLCEMPRVGSQRYLYVRCTCGDKQAVNFASLRGGKSSRCVKCANKGVLNSSYRHGLSLRERETPEYKLWASVRSNAKERGRECTIKPYEIVIPDKCPVLGITLTPSLPGRKASNGHGFKDTLPSVDRIDSSKGYVSGNIQVISWKANRLKSNNTVETLELILNYMRSYQQ